MSELVAQVATDQDQLVSVEQIVGQLSRALRIPEDLMPSLLSLPSTAGGFSNLETSAKGLNAWRGSLTRGLLPSDTLGWPGDSVFREALLGALAELDMGKFTRRHPALINVLLKNVMEVLARYEQDRKEVMGPDAEAGDNTESGKQEKQDKGKGSREGRARPPSALCSFSAGRRACPQSNCVVLLPSAPCLTPRLPLPASAACPAQERTGPAGRPAGAAERRRPEPGRPGPGRRGPSRAAGARHGSERLPVKESHLPPTLI